MWESGCSQDRVLQPTLMGCSAVELGKNKYNHLNKAASARTELTMFCTDSDVSVSGLVL